MARLTVDTTTSGASSKSLVFCVYVSGHGKKQ